MTLQVFDTLTLRKRTFRAGKGIVKLFLCGPTVYDHCHLGHARFLVASDTIVKYLKFRGYRTKTVMNVTDISNEIFENAEKKGQDPDEYSGKFFQSMLEDLKALEVDAVDEITCASHNVVEMIGWIRRLLDAKVAYKTGEGVFLDTSKVKGYGSLSHQSRRELALRRLDLSPTKRNPEDFFLWTLTKTERNVWDSPWGKGRPGQHIEDAAACVRCLGESYDINIGGEELVFPHHEATKAQIEAITRRPMCTYWMHVGLLRFKGRKMSKSLGNFITIREALRRYTVQALRLYFSLTHYRKPLDLRLSDLEKVARLSRSFQDSVEKIGKAAASGDKGKRDAGLDEAVRTCEHRFVKAMDDDFDTRSAVKHLINLAGYAGSARYVEASGSLSDVLSSLTKLSSILGVL